MALTKPRLTYFSSRGLTEPIRLLLADIGVDYEDVGVGIFNPANQPDDFKHLVATGLLPYDAVPLWQETSGFTLSQSQAIVRHISRTHGYYGENNQEAALIDQLHEGVIEINLRVYGYTRTYKATTDENVKAETKKAAEKDAHKFLTHFEKLLHKNHDGKGFIVGSKISHADIALNYLLENAAAQHLVNLNDFPLLAAYKERIDARPHLIAHRNNPKRYPTQPLF